MSNTPRYGLRLSRKAKQDAVGVDRWTYEKFGPGAAERYLALLTQSLDDLCVDPFRLGAEPRSDLAHGIVLYHLRHTPQIPSRLGIVKRPRHFIAYRVRKNTVEIVRILHDSMDLPRHLS